MSCVGIFETRTNCPPRIRETRKKETEDEKKDSITYTQTQRWLLEWTADLAVQQRRCFPASWTGESVSFLNDLSNPFIRPVDDGEEEDEEKSDSCLHPYKIEGNP